MTVTTQVSNEAYGNAPATDEAIVLTPIGVTPGTGQDVVIGNISVPAISAWSKVNVEQTVTLPVTPPAMLANDSQFLLWVEPDANYVTNPVYPHAPSGKQGVDEQTISITVPAGTTPPALGPLSDLAAGSVTTSASTLYWGKSFTASAVIQNLGTINPGPFTVRFVLVGASGNVSDGIFLGDSTVAGLRRGYDHCQPGRHPAAALARRRDTQQSGCWSRRRDRRSREPAQRVVQEQQLFRIRAGRLEGHGHRWLELRAQPALPGTTPACEKACCTPQSTQANRRETTYRSQASFQAAAAAAK